MLGASDALNAAMVGILIFAGDTVAVGGECGAQDGFGINTNSVACLLQPLYQVPTQRT